MGGAAKLEDKYPELRGDQRPVLAHEGQYHDHPLRAGDPSRRHSTGAADYALMPHR